MQSGVSVRKKQYANDGSLESVDAMLIKQATVFYTRVLGLGLPMDFQDVVQELRLAYVKARAKWNPEKAQFNTYCYTVARNEFNRRIARMVEDRKRLGLGSIDNLATNEEGDEVGDGYARYLSEEDEHGDPCERMQRRESFKLALSQLSKPTRELVRRLVANEAQRDTPCATLIQLAAHMGLMGPQLQAVQQELNAVFGVSVQLSASRRTRSKA